MASLGRALGNPAIILVRKLGLHGFRRAAKRFFSSFWASFRTADSELEKADGRLKPQLWGSPTALARPLDCLRCPVRLSWPSKPNSFPCHNARYLNPPSLNFALTRPALLWPD